MLNLLKINFSFPYTKCFIYSDLNDLKSRKMFSRYPDIINFTVSTLAFNSYNLDSSVFNQTFLSIDHIKIQELSFLPEYFLVTALFCLTLFALFSLRFVLNDTHFLIKFQYDNQLVFLLIFILSCYLVLIFQQTDTASLTFTSFNNTMDFNEKIENSGG